MDEHPEGGAIYVQFNQTPHGETIRQWSRHPFEGALRFDHLTHKEEDDGTA